MSFKKLPTSESFTSHLAAALRVESHCHQPSTKSVAEKENWSKMSHEHATGEAYFCYVTFYTIDESDLEFFLINIYIRAASVS